MKNSHNNISYSAYIFTEIVEGNIANRGTIKNAFEIEEKSYQCEAYKSLYLFPSDFNSFVKKKKSVAGYKGLHYSSYLLIDFDGERDSGKVSRENLEKVRIETVRFIKDTMKVYLIEESCIQFFFSGSKGFHIMIERSMITNCNPSVRFSEIDKLVVQHLTRGYKYADLSIYKTTFIIRIVNSVNPKSNLYKIPMTFFELEHLTVDEILELAKQPRTIEVKDTECNEESEKLSNLFLVCSLEQEINTKKNSDKIIEANNYMNSNDYNFSGNYESVCNYLSGKLKNYHDWLLCGLACASLGEKGRKFFITLSKNSEYPEDTEEIISKKFDTILLYYNYSKANRVTIATLFYIAKKNGYIHTESYSYTDEGNRDRFIEINVNELNYNIDSGKWFFWDGKCWVVDKKGMLSKAVDRVVLSLYEKSKNISDSRKKDFLDKHIKKTQSKIGREAMVELAKIDGRIICTNSDFDHKPNLFNCENGTIELFEDGSYKFILHNEKHRLTKISSVLYEPTSTSPYWIELLNTIFSSEKEKIRYFQKILGYTLTGYTDENVLIFCYGNGANGKSTVLEILKLFLGDYCVKTKIDILLKNKGESTGMDIARLTGARLVICSETDLGTSFDEGKIKDLTGGDTLVARQLYKEYYEFKPEFKIIMYGNNKPRIKGNDYGIRRRFKMIPFTTQIPVEQRVPQSEIIRTIQSEFSGILNWILEGYKLYKIEGLLEPTSVKSSTEAYFENSDVVGKFIEEECELNILFEEQVQNLFYRFTMFMKDIGEHPWTRNTFNEELAKRGFKKKVIGSRGTQWFGIALKNKYNNSGIDNLKNKNSKGEDDMIPPKL